MNASEAYINIEARFASNDCTDIYSEAYQAVRIMRDEWAAIKALWTPMYDPKKARPILEFSQPLAPGESAKFLLPDGWRTVLDYAELKDHFDVRYTAFPQSSYEGNGGKP